MATALSGRTEWPPPIALQARHRWPEGPEFSPPRLGVGAFAQLGLPEPRGTPRSRKKRALPMAMRRPATMADRPWPGWAMSSVTGGSSRWRSSAAAQIARAIGCWLLRFRSGGKSHYVGLSVPRPSASVSTGRPAVTVPVLSKSTVVARRQPLEGCTPCETQSPAPRRTPWRQERPWAWRVPSRTRTRDDEHRKGTGTKA